MRLRRVRCRPCAVTHVLVPASLMARRLDAVEVIGDALHLAALGYGHRQIAARLQRPPDTVRGWLRAARRVLEPVRACAARWYVSLDPDSGPVAPQGSPLADTVELLTQAARAWRLRFGAERTGPWPRAQWMTAGLFSPTPRLPP